MRACVDASGMARPLLSDDLWTVVEPLLPAERPKPKGGRPRVPDRAALTGILFVLRSGLPWEMLPQEMGCGSGMTCWRRLREWQDAGVWDRLHRVLLDRLGRAGGIDWRRACLDSASVPAKRGASAQARTRRIAVGRDRSGTSSQMPPASRLPSASPLRMSTTVVSSRI
jgi:transposase